VPASPWRAGAYQIAVDAALEDPAGNQIGRPFEIESFDTVARAPRSDRILLPLPIGTSKPS
jgi:hypothetical protein